MLNPNRLKHGVPRWLHSESSPLRLQQPSILSGLRAPLAPGQTQSGHICFHSASSAGRSAKDLAQGLAGSPGPGGTAGPHRRRDKGPREGSACSSHTAGSPPAPTARARQPAGASLSDPGAAHKGKKALREASSGSLRRRPCGAKEQGGRAGPRSLAQALGAGQEAEGQPGREVEESMDFSVRQTRARIPPLQPQPLWSSSIKWVSHGPRHTVLVRLT